MSPEAEVGKINLFEQAQYAFKQSLYAEEMPDLSPDTVSQQIGEIRELYRQTHKDIDYITLYSTLSGLAGEALEVAKVREAGEDTVEGLQELKNEYATITDALLVKAPPGYFDTDLLDDMSQAKGGTRVAEKEEEKVEEEEYEIDQLELKPYQRSALIREGIQTLESLNEWIESEEKIIGIGPKGEEQIKEARSNLKEEQDSE